MKAENLKQKFKDLLIPVALLLSVAAIAWLVIKPEVYAQAFAIIASVFLGAAVTAWATNHLIGERRKAEESKEKNVQIHQSKLSSFSKFIGDLWNVYAQYTDDRENLTSELLKAIRKQMFQNVIFHISPRGLYEINKVVSAATDKKNPKAVSVLCSGLTQIIKKELDDFEVERDEIDDSGINYETELRHLWSTLQSGITEFPLNNVGNSPKGENDDDCQQTTENLPIENVETILDYNYNQAWHFALWGKEQIDAISKWQADGRSSVDLSLVEYGETWRTNLLKQVEFGDIVFLFRRGGYGYIGAFKPLGWRVFDFNENIETIHLFNKEEEIVKGDRFESDVREFDIYGSRDDGADLCANLIVELVAYLESGVENPGGVYRRTISRYDSQYAAKLMERFKPYMINK